MLGSKVKHGRERADSGLSHPGFPVTVGALSSVQSTGAKRDPPAHIAPGNLANDREVRDPENSALRSLILATSPGWDPPDWLMPASPRTFSAQPSDQRSLTPAALNLGLNDGTLAPQAVVEALSAFNARESFRNYGTPRHDPVRACIAKADGVDPEQVFLHNGTGPILKLALPLLVRKRLLSSPRRLLRHAVARDGYPLYTPRWTYSKIPKKAAESGLSVKYLSLRPERAFRLDLTELRRKLSHRPGIVYLVNPNNPTGNLLFEPEEMARLISDFPESRFWIDEAYVQYADPSVPRCSAWVRRFDNVLVSRSFSFAYGMAALRIGYLMAPPKFVQALESKVTDYRLGLVQEAATIAALEDREHLPDLRERCEQGRSQLHEGLAPFEGIHSFPSTTNFVFCRRTDGQDAATLGQALAQRGILIKCFEPYGGFDNRPFFRITLGLPHENDQLLATMREILKVR